ncbi:polyphosphate kinase 1 [Alkanindiges sp. WGS2144]|uniref:polyphosphate kinase 1 n=1 Tax=Alkanindiges sp. WGS2144 TaxID=3366808 RepID=UPI0037503F63
MNPPANVRSGHYALNSNYINRELSILDFHLRVLEQAIDPLHPLLERLNFLQIFSHNLDEFFEIRVAGLLQQLSVDNKSRTPDGLTPSIILEKTSQIAHAAVERQYRILNETLLPQLANENIQFLDREQLENAQSTWIKQYFHEQIFPVLTSIDLDPVHPFPRLVNKSLNFIVALQSNDAFGSHTHLVLVPVPRTLPQVVCLPDELSHGQNYYVMLSAIIEAHISALFPGMTAMGCYQLRVTRDAHITLNEDVEDVAKAVQGELNLRHFGRAVRLEISQNCPEPIVCYLLKNLNLNATQLYRVNGPVNLARLVSDFNRPVLKYKPFIPAIPPILQHGKNIFAAMKQQDILLHHPFESFEPVIQLLCEAARDPQVLAIKQTLYRSGPDSEVVQTLAEAAKNGKEVTAIIELRARFDEESNMRVARVLQAAGAMVVYGVAGYKTHAKLMLVVRREQGRLQRYVHLGTGNYHAGNARLYTDYGLLSTDHVLCEEVHQIFQELTGMGEMVELKKLLQAPLTLHSQLMGFIEAEINNAMAGKPARIIVKINALTEQQLIDALYRASQAGVGIDLIVRSTCSLRPGVAGLSENIQVRSIVGRFLEHTRVYYFLNAGGEPRVYCASADWMERNMFSRIEACFPIENPQLKQRIIELGLLNYLQDNQQAWALQADGTWQRIIPAEGEPPHMAQQVLLDRFST